MKTHLEPLPRVSVRKGPSCRSWGVQLCDTPAEQFARTGLRLGRQRSDTEKIRLGTRRGGRQGCRFGPDIFNAAYAAALQDVVDDIRQLGLFVCCSHVKELDFFVCW